MQGGLVLVMHKEMLHSDNEWGASFGFGHIVAKYLRIGLITKEKKQQQEQAKEKRKRKRKILPAHRLRRV